MKLNKTQMIRMIIELGCSTKEIELNMLSSEHLSEVLVHWAKENDRKHNQKINEILDKANEYIITCEKIIEKHNTKKETSGQ